MHPLLKLHPLNNLSLKLLSVSFGYILWLIMSAAHVVTITTEIPVAFYNNETNFTIETTEHITVTLHGTRHLLRSLHNHLNIHIDMHTLHEGSNTVKLEEKFLLLPDTVKLVHYKPTTITITLSKAIKETA